MLTKDVEARLRDMLREREKCLINWSKELTLKQIKALGGIEKAHNTQARLKINFKDDIECIQRLLWENNVD